MKEKLFESRVERFGEVNYFSDTSPFSPSNKISKPHNPTQKIKL